MMFRSHTFFTLVVCVALLSSVSVLGQVTTGTLYGRVVDESGGIIPGAEVRLINEQTSFSRLTITNERGEFTLTFLPVGSYRCSVSMPGFKTHEVTRMKVGAGEKLNQTVTLEIGEITETLTVSSEAALLNTVSAEDIVSKDELLVKELPLGRRDISNLLNIGAGTALSGDGISINGLPEAGFTMTVDGVDASGNMEIQSISHYGNYNYIKGITLEAVEEVQVTKNVYSAEIANAMGGNVNIISKSGTNDYHGSLFWNYQAGGLNARYQFNSDKQPLVFHQFGASGGGPILKDRLFVFGAYEGYRQTESRFVSGDVPTAEFRAQATAAVPAYDQYFSLLPLPTEPYEEGAISARFQGNRPLERRDNHGTVRVDFLRSDNDQFSFKYVRGRPFSSTPRVNASNPRSYIGKMERFNGSYTRSGATWTSESRFGYNMSNTDRLDELFDLQGLNSIAGWGFGDGAEIFIISGDITSAEQVFALNRGRHSLKMGGIYLYWRSRRANAEIPVMHYSTLDDLFANTPSAAQFRFGPPEYEIQIWQTGAFIQDDIRVTPNLIVNAGVRYDYYSVPRERDDRFGNRDEPNGFGPLLPPDQPYDADYNNFSPRVGFAWTMDDSKKTVLNGGIGMFVNPHPVQGAMVNMVRTVDANGDFIASGIDFSREDAITAGINYPTTNQEIISLVTAEEKIGGYVTARNFPNPYSILWNFGIQREIGNDLVFDIGYLGNRGVKLTMTQDMNRPDRLTGETPHPDYYQFRRFDNSESTHYHGLQTSLKKRFSRGFSFDMYYTWSRSIGFTQRGDLRLTARSIENEMLWLERGPTDKDIPHRFVGNFLYEIPFAQNLSSRAARLVLDGWQLSGIVSAQSGEPFTVTQSASWSSQRPDFVGTSYADTYNEVGYSAGLQYLDKSAFSRVPIVPASGTTERPGTVGRHAFRRPGWWGLDLSVRKSFDVAEEMRLQLGFDMFNAFNQTNFSGVSSNVNSGSFGRVTSTRGARVTQLHLRFTF